VGVHTTGSPFTGEDFKYLKIRWSSIKLIQQKSLNFEEIKNKTNLATILLQIII